MFSIENRRTSHANLQGQAFSDTHDFQKPNRAALRRGGDWELTQTQAWQSHHELPHILFLKATENVGNWAKGQAIVDLDIIQGLSITINMNLKMVTIMLV